MTEDIKIVRLTTGEELLCQLIVEGDSYKLLESCIIVPTGNGNIGIARWMPYAEARTVTVSKKFVCFVVKPVAELTKKYLSMITNISLPTAAEVGAVTASAR